MKRGPLAALIIIIVVLIALAVWLLYPSNQTTLPPTSNPTSTTGGTSTSTAGPTFDQSISDGTITISYPSADFGLATNQTQVLVHPNIPPCDSPFNYCFYYIGSAYNGTNFESAGIRVAKTSISAANCLTAQPTGYTNLKPAATSTSAEYATSVFTPVSDAAAGHTAMGSVYRLRYQASCYEFDTRIGQSQFANYPSGTIQEFTPTDQAAVQSELTSVLATMKLPDGTAVSFPQI